MKINIDIPDWAEDKHIYIMAGIELIAYKYVNQEWKIKITRCNQCGLCCRGMNPDDENFPEVNEKGTCIYLKKDGKDKEVCSLGINRPFKCCIGRGRDILPDNLCSEEYD